MPDSRREYGKSAVTPQRPQTYSLPGACLVCGGDLIGSRERHFICTTCNLKFSEENLIRAGKLVRRSKLRPRKGQADEYYGKHFT